ncbi:MULTISPECIES: hypothetical protein [unclassified Paraburkholderia]|uniref:hypothetical protein n=1 Tax=unclassified Paraburkholderia TaxID=2615204 RepID=UPI0016129C48|nr:MULTISPECIES: hypothetical protein [unclassified Paraburkholderia]MBB5443644.1 hypothetical protein [Paraburkholderia sp. WSM4177]MBB5484135.1 hypothetical protein [Paraburkholderia sp. WSM4180]
MRHVSTTEMIQRLSGLLGTDDLTEWEQGFVRQLDAIRSTGHVTSLSDKQVERLDELHAKHFA